MSELAKRSVSSVVLAALLLVVLWLGGWGYLALLLLAGVVVLREFAQLVWRITVGQGARIAWMLFGFGYVALALQGLWTARAVPDHGLFWAAWLFLVVWATDIGAYAFGRLIGGPKIAPAISPSKTWAGLLGGIVFVTVVMAAHMRVLPELADTGFASLMLKAMMWGAPLAVIAQAGDFFESWMKRRAGVKDSGSLIPGHGGLFDRVDGLLPVAIVFFPWMGALTR